MATRERLTLVGNQAFSMLNFRASLIRSIVAAGVEVYALAPNYTADQMAMVHELGAKPVSYPLTRAGLNPLEDMVTFTSLVRTLKDIKPTINLAYAIKPVIYGTLAAKAANVPKRFAMIEGLGHVFFESSSLGGHLLKSAATSLYRIALSQASRTFFLNEDDKSAFVTLGILRGERAFVTGAIGVDIHAWGFSKPVYDPMTFLFAGRLLREKGILDFIEAAKHVKQRHPHVQFVVLGDIDTNPSSVTHSDVRQWVNDGLITWPGHVAVKPWLERSSVFVLPSYREGVPRSTQEAMSIGRPVITTDVPGCRDTVKHGWNGILVPPRDVGALTKAMESFILDPHLVAVMGERSRSFAEIHFDEEKKNAAFLPLIGLGT